MKIYKSKMGANLLLFGFVVGLLGVQSARAEMPGSTNGLHLSFESSWSLGTFAQGSTVPSRTINVISVGAVPSYRFGFVSIILDGRYFWVGQNTNPDTVSNTNVLGSGWSAAGGLGLHFGKVSLFGTYVYFGNYSLQNTNAAGGAQSYTKPRGFNFTLDYMLTSKVSIFGTYQNVRFETSRVDGTETSLTEAGVLQNYGLGLALRF